MDRGVADAQAADKKYRNWAETQIQYRPFSKRLFPRQWLVTPDCAVESFATLAYDQITARFTSDRLNNERFHFR